MSWFSSQKSKGPHLKKMRAAPATLRVAGAVDILDRKIFGA
ncbi:hypothetical protein IMCC12053_2175 [Celeribacter marinus]|uniref:Uncharacterized protein n=1 Tax=Celeribacter marinus TaxID=1397108 RepID=A0A0N9ZGM8_9RHOB|nr:hypothetical protein IMCC12053_2175 [Celeribacter marinus]